MGIFTMRAKNTVPSSWSSLQLGLALLLSLTGFAWLGMLPGCAQPSATPAASPTTKPALLINVTHGRDALHSVSMGLNLARMALQQGHRVVVFLNVSAPELATKSPSAGLRFADFPPVGQMLQEIMAAGGRVVVCGHCARVQRVSESDFIPGVVVAHHGELLNELDPTMVGFSY
jgi:predicted peroxiredoxin